jgi:hypothetical protein
MEKRRVWKRARLEFDEALNLIHGNVEKKHQLCLTVECFIVSMRPSDDVF